MPCIQNYNNGVSGADTFPTVPLYGTSPTFYTACPTKIHSKMVLKGKDQPPNRQLPDQLPIEE